MKKLVSLFMVLTLALGSSCSSNNKDTSGGSLEESNYVTRAEAAQMFYDHFGYYSFENTTTFIDLADEEYAEAVIWAEHF
ncbi:MAG: hypothetical protein FWD45_04790, partial [Coriobacteriia bacterium]|nr:hypothetical protein [Coriobacteriia bacterium]